MKKKKQRRLTLSRETIQRLDKPELRWVDGGGAVLGDHSPLSACLLPQTLQATCQTAGGGPKQH